MSTLFNKNVNIVTDDGKQLEVPYWSDNASINNLSEDTINYNIYG